MSGMRSLVRSPRALLHGFVYGSLLMLLLCLCATALLFSSTFLEKERSRASISANQLAQFFDFQYRSLGEEMWTKNYEAIDMRVQEIARQFGNSDYRLALGDEKGVCVFARGMDCRIPPELVAAPLQPGKRHSELNFDGAFGRYVYAVPLYVGAQHKGYLYATIGDSFEFFRGGRVAFALKVFVIPMSGMVLVWFAWLLLSERLILRPYLSVLVEMEKHRAVSELAAQVVHDIRSPLVALKSAIGAARGWDADQRRLITAASSRIENIADDLITHFTGRNSDAAQPFSFLLPVIDAIIAEKRSLLGEKSFIEIRLELFQDLAAASVPVSATEMSRVLSNLLNNAIEAHKGTAKGIITVAASLSAGNVTLIVRDDGMGIDAATLRKLRTMGGSYGKAGGAGIGLQHAKAVLANAGGSLEIESAPGDGTTVTLAIPTVKSPPWCAQVIDVSDARTIVVLDDDPSVHLLWRQRLGEDRLVSLTDPEQFDLSRYPPETTRYILDYEILGCPVTGLDLIVTHGLSSRATLVTSYFNESKVQRAIEKAGARMLPKFMIGTVRVIRTASPSVTPTPVNADAILIDDDPLVRLTWSTAAKRQGRALRVFSAVGEFLAEASAFDRATPVYVDAELSEGAKGEVESIKIRDLGFGEVYLATGHEPGRFAGLGHLRGVVGKEPPWNRAS